MRTSSNFIILKLTTEQTFNGPLIWKIWPLWDSTWWPLGGKMFIFWIILLSQTLGLKENEFFCIQFSHKWISKFVFYLSCRIALRNIVYSYKDWKTIFEVYLYEKGAQISFLLFSSWQHQQIVCTYICFFFFFPLIAQDVLRMLTNP